MKRGIEDRRSKERAEGKALKSRALFDRYVAGTYVSA